MIGPKRASVTEARPRLSSQRCADNMLVITVGPVLFVNIHLPSP